MSAIDLNKAPVPNPFGTLNPCAACTVRDLSICQVLNETDLQRLAEIATTMEIAARAPILDEGEDASYLFNVTGGTVKLYKLLPDGRRQITGFLYGGDFLGIAMNEQYAYSAEAVTGVTLCRFPRKKFEHLLTVLPNLEQRLLSAASNELVQAQDQMVLLGRKTAKEKIVSFLLALSRRLEARDKAPSPVHLPMSRSDIADYLGLTTETVSRTFSALKRNGDIRLLDGGKVELPDIEALTEIADGY
ncbi:MAG: helix-turn-helix domain-containing protein [Alphaproteobacteria bacterium]|nr:helix-turn-helix domain-containing protein [Alphaproteobacteria bacterium]